MQNSKKLPIISSRLAELSLVSAFILVFAISISGCTLGNKSSSTAPSGAKNAGGEVGATEKAADKEKVGDSTFTGTVSAAGGQFMLNRPGQPTLEIDSYSVSLGDYVGKSVTVTGQYSGDTLFVGKIE